MRKDQTKTASTDETGPANERDSSVQISQSKPRVYTDYWPAMQASRTVRQ